MTAPLGILNPAIGLTGLVLCLLGVLQVLVGSCSVRMRIGSDDAGTCRQA